MTNPIRIPVEQIQELKAAQQNIPILEAEIKRAERAGIDMTPQKKELAELKEKVTKLLAVYG